MVYIDSAIRKVIFSLDLATSPEIIIHDLLGVRVSLGKGTMHIEYAATAFYLEDNSSRHEHYRCGDDIVTRLAVRDDSGAYLRVAVRNHSLGTGTPRRPFAGFMRVQNTYRDGLIDCYVVDVTHALLLLQVFNKSIAFRRSFDDRNLRVSLYPRTKRLVK